MTTLNVIFHVVVSVYRLVKNWNSPQFRIGQLVLILKDDMLIHWVKHAQFCLPKQATQACAVIVVPSFLHDQNKQEDQRWILAKLIFPKEFFHKDKVSYELKEAKETSEVEN